MKKLFILTVLVSLAAVLPADAESGKRSAKPQAAKAEYVPPGVEIVARDEKGRPSKIKMEGQEYLLCASDNADGCINPREAGFRWGNEPVKEWPGRPISREN